MGFFFCGLFQRQPARQPAQPARTEGLHGAQGEFDGVEFSPRTSLASSHNEEITTTRPSTTAARPVPPANVQNPELAGYYSPTSPPPPRPRSAYRPPAELRGFYEPSASMSRPLPPRPEPPSTRARPAKPVNSVYT